jgi:hypothetical protein
MMTTYAYIREKESHEVRIAVTTSKREVVLVRSPVFIAIGISMGSIYVNNSNT